MNPDKIIAANAIDDTIGIRSNCRWSVVLVSGWQGLELGTREGEGNEPVRLIMQKNNETTSREAKLRIASHTGVILKEVRVQQRGIAPYLEVNTPAIHMPFEGGEEVVSIRSNAAWKVLTSGREGFTTDVVEGSGDGSVRFTVDENLVEETRETTFTIVTVDDGLSGTASADIHVTQSAREIKLLVNNQEQYELPAIEATGGSVEVALTCTDDWTVSGQFPGFSCDLRNGSHDAKVKITADENMSEDERFAIFTFQTVGTSVTKTATLVVPQKGKVVELNVPMTEVTAQAIGGTYPVQILCNATWNVTSNSSWAKVDSEPVAGNGYVQILCEQNAMTSVREAVIEVRAGRNQVRYITIVQQPGAYPTVGEPAISDVTKYEAVATFDYQSSTSAVGEYGVCYATHEAPTNADHVVSTTGDATTGRAVLPLAGLTSGMTYYVRAFARNATGISYSEKTVSFTTKGDNPGDDTPVLPSFIKRK